MEHTSYIENDCVEVVNALIDGRPEAVGEIYRRLSAPLVRLAARHIPSLLQPKIDAEDVVIEAFEDLLAINSSDINIIRRNDISNWNSLQNIIGNSIISKCKNYIRQFNSRSRDVRREQSISQVDKSATDPTPEDDAAFSELVMSIFNNFSASDHEIIRQLIDGFNVREIATDLKTSEHEVRVVREKLSFWLQTRITENSTFPESTRPAEVRHNPFASRPWHNPFITSVKVESHEKVSHIHPMSDDSDMWPAPAELWERFAAKLPAVFAIGSIIYHKGKTHFKAGPVPACPKCGTRPVRGRTRITFHYAPLATHEQEVEAWVCPCGEAYVPGDVARAAHAAAFASAQ